MAEERGVKRLFSADDGREASPSAAAGPAALSCAYLEDLTLSHRARVLATEEIMLKVMAMVGGGHFFFVAAVGKGWRRLYFAAHLSQVTSLRHSVLKSVECLNWAVRDGWLDSSLRLSLRIFCAVAKWGDLSICQALYRMGCVSDEDVCEAAALNPEHGLSILKWLRSEDLPDKSPCPWDERTCTLAATRGDVDMLTWLLSDEVNAPFDWGVWQCRGTEAAQEGQINVLDLLLRHRRVRPKLESAAIGGGSEWRDAAFFTAMNGSLKVLCWLHANARDLCDWDRGVCYIAVARAKSLPMLQWLRSESVMCPWDSSSCPEWLLARGRWDGGRNEAFEGIKQWVHANGHPCDCED